MTLNNREKKTPSFILSIYEPPAGHKLRTRVVAILANCEWAMDAAIDVRTKRSETNEMYELHRKVNQKKNADVTQMSTCNLLDAYAMLPATVNGRQ